MVQPTKRSALEVLKREQLLEVASAFELDHRKSDRKDELVEVIATSKRASFERVLESLTRVDLKEICRAHELDDKGRAVRPIIDRILGREKAPALPGVFKAAPVHGDDSPGATDTSPDSDYSPEQSHAASARDAEVGPASDTDIRLSPAAGPAAGTARRLIRSIPVADPAAIPKPGELVHVRHRQYLVEAVHRPSEPKQMTRLELVCLDDDNQGRPLEVLWELELGARRLDPASHGLGDIERLDEPRHFAAYLHAIKWNCVTATNARLFQAPFRAGIQIFQHQLAPLRKALELPRANLFIADDVGLGKTVEAGLVMQELLLRQRLDFVVIVVPAAITLQWRQEMERRFGLNFEIYNRAFVARRRRERGFGVNPWSTHNRFIISYQTLRRPEYRDPLLQVLGPRFKKSMLVLDEAHTVAPASAAKYAVDSSLTRVARDFAPRFENRLFLSATPHNGHSNSFSALLEILDPQRFTRGVKVRGPEELQPIMVRRLKKDLKTIGSGEFPDRRLIELQLVHRDGHWWQEARGDVAANDPVDLGPGADAELQLAELLRDYSKQTRPARGRGVRTFIILQKRLLSSVEAFYRTLHTHANTVRKRAAEAAEAKQAKAAEQQELSALDEEVYGRDDDAETEDEVRASSRGLFFDDAPLPEELLDKMIDVARKHRGEPGAKALSLLDWVRRNQCPAAKVGGPDAKADGSWTDRRLLIFTEYTDTKRFLHQFLANSIAGTDLAEHRIATLQGGMADERRDEIQRAFNGDPAEHPVRILIATDTAREGINLQGHCADLVHFDIPWNPAKLEQRNGRIDRTLQPSPEVRCMYFTQPQRPEDRVLSTLVTKVSRIQEELGSLSQVVMERIDRALADGIDERSEERLSRAEAERESERVVAEELEAPRAEVAQLRKELDVCGQMEEESRRQMEFDPILLKDAIDVGCELAGVGTLQRVEQTSQAKDSEELWALPEFPHSWSRTLDSLREPRARDEDWIEWRRKPLLPVAFRPGKHMSIDRVHLHLQHPFVQRVMARFTAQGYSSQDLSRVTVVRTRYTAAARVVAFGRLSLFGAGATRLHDRVIPIVAPWLEGKGKTHLQPFVSEADREALIRFEDALREAPALEDVSVQVRDRLTGSARGDFAALWPHIEAEAQAEEARAVELLEQRGEVESKALTQILERQRRAIEETLQEGSQLALKLEEHDKDQRKQFEQDEQYMRQRLERIDREIAEEPAQIRAGYEVVARRLEPLGLVYLWPQNR